MTAPRWPQERAGTVTEFSDATYTLKWIMDNELDFVVVAIYQKHLSLSYVEELLPLVKLSFLKLARSFVPSEIDFIHPCSSFTPSFLKIYAEVEKRAIAEKVVAKKQRWLLGVHA